MIGGWVGRRVGGAQTDRPMIGRERQAAAPERKLFNLHSDPGRRYREPLSVVGN